jgi:molybdopterin-guanine dinucleotide biosynthesis protein A
MTAAILSGGENSRFPRVKGFIRVGGRPIMEVNLELLRSIFACAVVSTNEPERYFGLGAPLIGDVVPRSGPLSGIYSVLFSTRAPEVFVSACDMPFLSGALIRHIVATRKRTALATVPVYDGRPQPLLAVYSSALMGRMKRLLSEGRTSLIRMLADVSREVQYVEEPAVTQFDPEGRSFININTPEDYDKAFRDSNVPARRIACSA